MNKSVNRFLIPFLVVASCSELLSGHFSSVPDFSAENVAAEICDLWERSNPLDESSRFGNLSWEFIDDGNGDGHPDAGELCQVIFTIQNWPAQEDAQNVSGELFTADRSIDLSNPYCTFPDIPEDSTASSTPVELYVDPEMEPHIADFVFTVYADNLSQPQSFEFSVALGRARWLVVDDDDGEDEVDWFLSSFGDLNLYTDIWDGQNPVSIENLESYELVFWATGREEDPLSDGEQAAICAYLDGGGNLLLSSQYVGEQLGGTGFFTEYLHVEHSVDNVLHSWVDGIDGTPLAEGMELLLAGGTHGAANNISPSAGFAIDPAVEFLQYADQAYEYAGILYDSGNYRVIYLGFPIEAIGGLHGTNSRHEFLQAVLEWFDSVESVEIDWPKTVPEVLSLVRAYPNPFNPVTHIECTLSAEASLDLELFNLTGARVMSIVRSHLPAGISHFRFDGADLASGVYMANITAHPLSGGISQQEQLKLILLK